MNFSKICIFDETVSILRVVSYSFSYIFSCGLFSVNFVQRKSFHLPPSRRTDQLKYRREDSNVRKRSQTSKKNNVLLFLGGVLAIPVFS